VGCERYVAPKEIHVERPVLRSIGLTFRTFREKKDDTDILETLSEIAKDLEKDLERTRFAGQTVTVKYKVRRSEAEHQ
jgi:DNA polymerase kappa